MNGCLDKIRISVVIPVLNEEQNIDRCLCSLQSFDDIIVVDSGSTDSTKELVSRYDVKFVKFTWNGSYPKKRNWALENLDLKYEWVLFLDADEKITPEVTNELRSVPNSLNEGYYLTYTNYFLGRKMRFGIPMK
ncbi:glycosyltransferase family 2 protein, partial [bacterium]|nr:glycosyltransferase family 2 protein [bacterium]